MSDSPLGSSSEEKNFTIHDAELTKRRELEKNLSVYRSSSATSIGAGSHSISYAAKMAAAKAAAASKSATTRRNLAVGPSTSTSPTSHTRNITHTPLTRSVSSPSSPISRSFSPSSSSSSSSKIPFDKNEEVNRYSKSHEIVDVNEEDDSNLNTQDDNDEEKDDDDEEEEDYEMPDWLRISHSKNNEVLLRAAQRGHNSALLSSTTYTSSSSNAVIKEDEEEGIINTDTSKSSFSHSSTTYSSYSSTFQNEESAAMMDSALLASPELSSKIFRLKTWEESLRKKEFDLTQRETAVSLVDSRLKLVHRLKQDVEAREAAVKEREIKVSDRECAVDEIVRNASADERTQLSSLLTEVSVLRERLMRDLDKREARVCELEAQYEPKFRSVEAKEAAVRSLLASMKETLDQKEAELAAMAVAVRDVASQFRLPHIAAQANAALASVLRSQAEAVPKSMSSSITVLQPQLSPTTISESRNGGEGEMLHWLDERFKRQQSELQNAKSHSPEGFVLPKDITRQAQAQADVQRFTLELGKTTTTTTPTPKRAAPKVVGSSVSASFSSQI
jgi:hypothetical protein